MADIPKIIRVEEFLKERYEFRYNIISNDVEYRMIGGFNDGEKDLEYQFEVCNEEALKYELMCDSFRGFDKELNALMKYKFMKPYDPFSIYFEELGEYDPATEPDYITELLSYVEIVYQDENKAAEERAYFELMFKKHLVRQIACALTMIPFNKQCFVFYSTQNDGKTSFIRNLCPPSLKEYITENINFAEPKDSKIALSTNFMINLDEMASLSKQDINVCKSFMTLDSIKLRRPYDKKETTAPRRATFWGTTNNQEYLSDETGSVRWITFEVKSINHDYGGKNGYSSVNIDNVWKQAYHLLKTGFKFQMDNQELKDSEERNKLHQKTTTEMELIKEFFVPSEKGGFDEVLRITAEFMPTYKVRQRLDYYTNSKLDLKDFQIGKALRFLGFKQDTYRMPDSIYPLKGYWIIDTQKSIRTSEIPKI